MCGALPLAHAADAVLVLGCAARTLGVEALIGRSYGLGRVCATPLALFDTEFAGARATGELVTERAVDTVVGAAAGFPAAVSSPSPSPSPSPTAGRPTGSRTS
ncbi:FUSC family protein [Streptomyces sp. NPDC046985]|uniref:FUSC family protein n=1 Tax=Streptomyces sp. NPDC046985 TaxID=3155377 RepID=UPI003404340D